MVNKDKQKMCQCTKPSYVKKSFPSKQQEHKRPETMMNNKSIETDQKSNNPDAKETKLIEIIQ
jgi:hypothetical protein